MIDDLTVLVPLHRSERFFEVLDENLERLATTCRVTVSDPTEGDNTLARLARRWAGQPTIEFLGRRDLPSGWVPHYNDLWERCRTEHFMWLAHDDSIEAEYVGLCREALRARPDVVGAYGRQVAVEGPGLDLRVPPWPIPTEGGTPGEAVTAMTTCNPAVAFCGVFRRDATTPLPLVPVDGRWADVMWIFSLMSTAKLVAVPEATYHKRWYPESTHRQWPGADLVPLLSPLLVAELLRRFPNVDTADEVGRLMRWLEDHVRFRRDHVAAEHDSLRAALTQVTRERDRARSAIRSLRSSRSWKIGQSVARLARWVRFPRR